MKKTKDVVAGLGEIGLPIFKLLTKNRITVGYDLNSKLMNQKLFDKYLDYETIFLHICIPYSNKFQINVNKLYDKFLPKCIVVHSTISLNTTRQIQNKLKIPIIYSATGVFIDACFQI